MYIVISQKIDNESSYDDKLYELYHFPKRYVNQIKAGDVFLYYQGDRLQKDNRYYFGTGVVGKIESEDEENFYAELKEGRTFAKEVSIYVTSKEEAEGIDKYLESLGYAEVRNSPIPPWQSSIRPISETAYKRILGYAGKLIDYKESRGGRLKDLSILLVQARDNYKENFNKSDFCLTDEFKNKYASYLRNNGQNIIFNETTAIINTSGNLQIYAPNQWFVIASFVIEYLQELIKYKDIVDKILSVKSMTSKEKKEYITKLKEEASDDEILELNNLATEYFGTEMVVEVRNIVKFLTDYTWWSGSKTIDRGDYYVSPILNLLGLVNASQSYVADIAYILASVPELSDIANKQISKDNIPKRESRSVSSLITKNVERKKGGQNLIVYGAPGTGKSRALEDLLISGNWENKHYENFISEYRRVIFHPEYTYFDFVGTYKPVPVYKKTEYIFINAVTGVENNMEPYIDYQFVPGPFIETLTDAWVNPDKMFTLLIEEINRANAAAVFGEVFQLLDRLSDGTSEYVYYPYRDLLAYLYSVEGLKEYVSDGVKIPSNMNIVATMNSADQGVNFLDAAFKRRWNYKYKKIDIGNAVHKDAPFKYAGMTVCWGDFVTALNEKLIKTKVEEDRLIGPYFIKPNEMDTVYATDKLLLYLWDDVLRHQRTQFFSNKISTFSELTDKFLSKDVLELGGYFKSEIADSEDGIFAGEEQEEVI